ncbi:MAG: hypothetical protein ACO1O4_13620 [Devosia sp.]
MAQTARSALKALGWEIHLATLSLKLDVLIGALERRYRPDQPRMPKGTPEGGQWIDDLLRLVAIEAEPDRVLVAGPRCDGFSSGCQNGGSFGTTGMYSIFGQNLCRHCAIKFLGLEGLPHLEQLETIELIDPNLRRKGTDVIKSASTQSRLSWGFDLRAQGGWAARSFAGL